MSIVLVGGMTRLEARYREEARKHGHELHVFSQANARMAARIRTSDAMILFTNKISHHARNEAVLAAKKDDVPIFMFHSCGLCTLRDCLRCLGSSGESQA